ncbi:MAG: hypothetical protein WCE75_10200 [Terracidiphilus sp.]
MRLARALLLWGFLPAFVPCLIPLESQTAPPKTAPAKPSHKLDRRYAVARGSWSAAAVSLFNTWSAFDDNPHRHMSFYSPDRKKQIEVAGANVYLHIRGKTYDTGIDSVQKHDAELSWAPDSTKYFVTWTESGELGPWHMQVYGVDDSGAHEFPNVGEAARKDFEQRVRRMPIDPELDTPGLRGFWEADQYCEPYHVIGGRWLNGSKEILLSVLIRNTGDCRYESEFNVYRVNATTGEILERFSAQAAHKRFGGRYLPRITP